MQEQNFSTDSTTQDQPSLRQVPGPPALSASEVLIARKEEVISNWVKRTTREISQAATLDRPSLINALPRLVDCIARALAASSARVAADECTEMAHFHGGERARVSDYNPDELVQEYCIFCEVLLDTIGDKVKMSTREYLIIYKVIGWALQDSMVAYSDIQTDFRERFIATLAHDLRNPLGVARTAAELISLESENPEEVYFLAERLKTNLSRADDLMQSLLDVAYMHSGYELNYQMEEIDLLKLATETVQSMTLTHGEHFMVKGADIIGYWNRSALRRALENLLTNALKYGEREKPIVVELKSSNYKVELKVHNDGRPIPTNDQKKIFQPFRREKTVLTEKPGWGLGLCFVQAAAEAHGGHVKVRSEDGYGTDFIIELPQDSRKSGLHGADNSQH